MRVVSDGFKPATSSRAAICGTSSGEQTADAAIS